jgi:uncharacterized protein YggU (UPF0235/DUF167 family)
MKILVKAKPSAREERVEKIDEDNFIVSVKELPVNGMANMAIVKVLAEYFRITPSKIRMISGFSSRQKIFEIVDD